MLRPDGRLLAACVLQVRHRGAIGARDYPSGGGAVRPGHAGSLHAPRCVQLHRSSRVFLLPVGNRDRLLNTHPHAHSDALHLHGVSIFVSFNRSLGVTRSTLDDSLVSLKLVVVAVAYYLVSFGDAYLNIYSSQEPLVETLRFVFTSL